MVRSTDFSYLPRRFLVVISFWLSLSYFLPQNLSLSLFLSIVCCCQLLDLEGMTDCLTHMKKYTIITNDDACGLEITTPRQSRFPFPTSRSRILLSFSLLMRVTTLLLCWPPPKMATWCPTERTSSWPQLHSITTPTGHHAHQEVKGRRSCYPACQLKERGNLPTRSGVCQLRICLSAC